MILNHLPRERASSLFPKDSGGKPAVPEDAYLVGNASGKLETKMPAEVRVHIDAEPAGSADAVNVKLSAHTASRNNPHRVTAVQAGADAAGTAEQKVAVHTADQQAHKALFDAAARDAQTKANTAEANAKKASRPSTWLPTAAEIGAIQSGSKATTAEARAGTDNTKWMTPIRTKEAMEGKITLALQPGDIIHTMRKDIGSGFLPCDGSMVNTSSYPALSGLLPKTINLSTLGAATALAIHMSYPIRMYNNTIYFVDESSNNSQWKIRKSAYPFTTTTIANTGTNRIIPIGYVNGYYYGFDSSDRPCYSTNFTTWTVRSDSFLGNSKKYVFSSGLWAYETSSSSGNYTHFSSIDSLRNGSGGESYTVAQAIRSIVSDKLVMFTGGLYRIDATKATLIVPVLTQYGYFCTAKYTIGRNSETDLNYYIFDNTTGAKLGTVKNGELLYRGSGGEWNISYAQDYGIFYYNSELFAVDAAKRIILPIKNPPSNILDSNNILYTYDNMAISLYRGNRKSTSTFGLVLPQDESQQYSFIKCV